MLQELDIRNYALIDRVKMLLSPGLNILTGETGAGKSIIIGAVSLVLGERASTDMIRTGADSASVRATVEISQSTQTLALLESFDLESEILILSREVSKSSRSRCWINDQSATLTTLREIGDQLVDIHGQHEHQTLFRRERHLDILDDFGGSGELRRQMADIYAEMQKQQSEYERLVRDRDEIIHQRDLLEFQLKELEDAKLEEGEEKKLLRERQILSNAELIFELAGSIYQRLYDSEDPSFTPVLDIMKSIRADILKLRQIDEQLAETESRFDNAIYDLEDIASQILDYRDKTDFDPRRLTEIETRLDLIYKLKRKYAVNSVADLIAYKDNVAKALEDISLSSTRIDEVKNRFQKLKAQARDIALNLSKERKEHAKNLKSLVEKELHTLGMEKTVLEVQVIQSEAKNETSPFVIEDGGRKLRLSPDGVDSIEFLISPNVGEEPRPLTKIASGGEISRIMLALKTILATGAMHTSPATMIFDEIDTGIGGRIAEVIGRKLKELAKSRQVICITHLPQIASLADAHCLVQKKIEGNRTFVGVQKLDDDERVKEIARMMAGEKITDVTIAHAREMIKQAAET